MLPGRDRDTSSPEAVSASTTGASLMISGRVPNGTRSLMACLVPAIPDEDLLVVTGSSSRRPRDGSDRGEWAGRGCRGGTRRRGRRPPRATARARRRTAGSPPRAGLLPGLLRPGRRLVTASSSTKPWRLIAPSRPSAATVSSTRWSIRGSEKVVPLVLMPALVSSRHRGTTPATVPSRSMRASAVNSRPRHRVCTMASGVRRTAQARSSASSARYTSREPRPKRGLTTHGPGSASSPESPPVDPVQHRARCRESGLLDRTQRTATCRCSGSPPRRGSTRTRRPAPASRSRAIPRGAISSATVVMTAADLVVFDRVHDGRARTARRRRRGGAGTRRRGRVPAASGSGSAAITTCPARVSARITETPAAPPAPVTRTRVTGTRVTGTRVTGRRRLVDSRRSVSCGSGVVTGAPVAVAGPAARSSGGRGPPMSARRVMAGPNAVIG